MRWLVLAPVVVVLACGDAYKDAAVADADAGALDAGSHDDGASPVDAGDAGTTLPEAGPDGDDAAITKGGALDTTFGNGTGKLKLPSASAWEVSASGVFILAHTSQVGGPIVDKYKADGTLDATWGGTGSVEAKGAPQSVTYWCALGSDGSAVVFGQTSASDVFLYRFTKEGGWDKTFGGNGKGVVEEEATGDFLYDPLSVAISPAGRILYGVSRSEANGTIVTSFVRQLLSNGSADPGFVVPTPPASGRVDYNAFAFSPSGDTLAVGSTPDAVFFSRFGAAGGDVKSGSTSNWGTALAAASAVVPYGTDGALAFGFATNGPNFHSGGFAVVRYTPAGQLDPTFGGNGATVKRFGTDNNRGDRATSGAVDQAGRIVAAGVVDGRLAVARYLPNGAFDTSFGADGHVELDLPTAQRPRTAILADGTIAVLAADSANDQAMYLYHLRP